MVISKYRWFDLRRWVPEAVGILTGLGGLEYLMQRNNVDDPSLDMYVLASLLGCGVSALVGLLSNARWKDHVFAFKTAIVPWKRERLIREYKKYLKDDKDQGRFYIELGFLLGKEGRYDDALDCFKIVMGAKYTHRLQTGFWPLDYVVRRDEYKSKAVELAREIGDNYQEGGAAKLPLDHLISWFPFLRKKDPPAYAYITYALWHTLHRKKENAKEVWEKLETEVELNEEERLEVQVLRAMSLELLGEKEESSDIWTETIESIVERNEFNRVGESRNEVLAYRGSHFLSQTLVFKRVPIEEDLEEKLTVVEQEQENINHFSEMSVRTVESLGTVKHNGYQYHVVKYAGNSLEEFLHTIPEDKRITYLEEIIEQLAYFHSKQGISNEDELFYTRRSLDIGFEQLSRHVKIADLEEDERERFEKNYRFIDDILKDAPHAWYRDANPRNWTIDDYDTITAIDLEGDRYAPVQIDLVSLLEFGSDYITEDIRASLIEKYIAAYEKINHLKVDRPSFMLQYQAARVQRHIELAGYRARDSKADKQSKEYSMMIYHLRHAIISLDKLCGEDKEKKAAIIPIIKEREEKLAA